VTTCKIPQRARVAAGTETSNASTGSRSVCDNANKCADAGPFSGIKVDKKNPLATITTPASNAVYEFKQPVNASYGCSDGGISTCTGAVANGNGTQAIASASGLPTSYPGAQTLTANAKDNVGHIGSASSAFTVVFNFGGFLSPIGGTVINQVSGGKNVPVPFKLTDYSGASVSTSLGTHILVPGYPAAKAVTCRAGTTTNKITTYTTLSGLRYDSKNSRYEYDLQVPTSWVGTCQQISFKYRDGTTQSFYLAVTK
jgi:hypothetical protein